MCHILPSVTTRAPRPGQWMWFITGPRAVALGSRMGVQRHDCRLGLCVTSKPKEAPSSGYGGLSATCAKATNLPASSPGR